MKSHNPNNYEVTHGSLLHTGSRRTHNPNDYEVTAKDHLVSLDKQSNLEAWTITTPDGDKLVISVAVNHMRGIGFSTTDWRGPQPRTFDEIRNYDWVSFDGQGVILPFGMSTLFV